MEREKHPLEGRGEREGGNGTNHFYEPDTCCPSGDRVTYSYCFVATAVYGSYDCPEVMKLRTFRDDCLRKYALGRAFIAVYYRYGPKLAEAVKSRRLLSTPIKSILDIFIRIFLDRKPGS